MNKYAYFDGSGKLLHTITTTGQIEEVPLKVVNVTDVMEKFNAIDKDGNLIWIEPQKDIEQVRQEKLAEIRQKFQNLIDAIKSKYAPYEIESFADQRTEWRAWVADNTAKTPIVDALAQARGVDREVLLQKIGEKATQIIYIQGIQNKLEDEVSAMSQITDIDAVDVDNVINSVMEGIQ